MTDEVFEDLVNLYLDKEISPAQLQILRNELERSPERQSTFQSYCRMHQATHFAALSACPVVPRQRIDTGYKHNKPSFFALNRQVWAAAALIALIGSFATVYFNGPFGSARIAEVVNSGVKLEKIDKFTPIAVASEKASQPPLEFYRSLQAENANQNWDYAQELRHVRAASNYHTLEQPSIFTLVPVIPDEALTQDEESGFQVKFSNYEFRR